MLGDSALSQIKEYAKGGEGREKEPEEMRDQRERTTDSLFIFHLVPVSLLFNNFPYVRFTLTTKRKEKTFPNVTFIRRVSPSRGHDFSASARPLTCHSHILFFSCQMAAATVFPWTATEKLQRSEVRRRWKRHSSAQHSRQRALSVSGGDFWHQHYALVCAGIVGSSRV